MHCRAKYGVNEQIDKMRRLESSDEGVTEGLRGVAEQHLPQIRENGNMHGISDALFNLITERRVALLKFDIARCRNLDREIQRARRQERRKSIRESVSKV